MLLASKNNNSMATPEHALYPADEVPKPEDEVRFDIDAGHKCATCKGELKAGGDALCKKEPVIDQLIVDGKIGLHSGTKEIWRHYPACPSPEEVSEAVQ